MKNQTILQRQSENYIKGELSNVSSVLQTPQILVTYYPINADKTTTLDGLKNIQDYIDPSSTVVYDKIENMPMSGVDNLVTQSQFDEEIGYDEDFSSSGIILPNTIIPKPNDFFIIPNAVIPALYVVTSTSPVTARSNPFTEIQFRLYSRDPEKIAQLNRQVDVVYTTTVTSIGTHHSLIIEKDNLFKVEDHITSYLDLCNLYTTLFYDTNKASFVYNDVYDSNSETLQSYVDMILWKLMFDYGVIIFDDIITYANNNFAKSVERIYTSCPDIYLNDYDFKKTTPIIIYNQDKKSMPLEKYRYPLSTDIDHRISKYQGTHINYIEQYGDEPDENAMYQLHNVWDDDFLVHIKDNNKYVLADDYSPSAWALADTDTNTQANYTFRNAIISWYNEEDIDFDTIAIAPVKNVENYELIPLILAFYKAYINDLQK